MILVKHKQVFITAPNRSKSYQNDMNKNCLEELPYDEKDLRQDHTKR